MIPLVLLAFSLITYSDNPKDQDIQLSTTVLQGQVLEFKFTPAPPKKREEITLHFLDKDIPCYSGEDGFWHGLIGIRADAETKKHIIKIMSDGQETAEANIEILPSTFPQEPLRLSPDKKALEDSEEQVRSIRSAFATENAEKLWAGEFIRPVRGKIESLYGEKRTVDGVMRPGFHKGVDLGIKSGTPILAANHGRVLLAAKYPEEGNFVIIDHGQGVASAYLHLSKILVKKGQLVKKGDTIGLVGSTGISNSPHLHFGIYIHDTPIDPLYWFAHSNK